MKIVFISVIIILSFSALIILGLHIKSRRPLRSAAVNALFGILALAAVNLTARFTGVEIPLNIYTVPGAAVFGIPAACAFVLFEAII